MSEGLPSTMKTGIHVVKIELIDLPAKMLRAKIELKDVETLADDIRVSGLLQPLLVRAKSGGRFELIDGCRRYYALKQIGERMVDVRVIDVPDEREALMKALEANLQRESLNPIEEAEAYRRLHDDYGYSMDVIARRVGKTKPYVSMMVRLLKLPGELRGYVQTSELTPWAAYEFLKLKDEELILKVFHEKKPREWTVRDVRERVAHVLAGEETPPAEEIATERAIVKPKVGKEPDWARVEIKKAEEEAREPATVEEAKAQGRMVPLGEAEELPDLKEPKICIFDGKPYPMSQMRHVWMHRRYWRHFTERLEEIKRLVTGKEAPKS